MQTKSVKSQSKQSKNRGNIIQLESPWTANTNSAPTGQRPTRERFLEDKTRMTINGKRYRVGNPNHPFNDVYVSSGIEAVYEKMGLLATSKRAQSIRKTVLALYDRTREGFVYLIGNPAWGGWLKCGMAIDADDRFRSYNTGSPYRDYKVHYTIFTTDRHKTEKRAHEALKKSCSAFDGEWFFIDVPSAKRAIKSIL